MKNTKFGKVPQRSHIQLRSSTWNKDSHGLYDYESTAQNYKNDVYYIDATTIVYRDSVQSMTTLQHKSDAKQLRQTFIPIANIHIDRKENKSTFKFEPLLKNQQDTNSYDPTRTFYKVIRENNPQTSTSDGFPLKPGNIIKMGRVEYMVIEMKNNVDTLTIRDTNHFKETNGIFQAKKTEDQPPESDGNQVRCKVCLCSEETETDPLISPCLCKGSLAKIHVGCLRQWINSKVKKEINDIATSYNFTKFQCEICKCPFPRIIKVDSSQIEMMTICKPTKPYIILESLNRTHPQVGKDERCLHLISAKENSPIRIGRGHQCEIRLTDISVSRAHAQIVFKNDQFYIKDQKSKFGTLIKFNEKHIFQLNETLKIQFGRTLYELELKNPTQEVDTDE